LIQISAALSGCARQLGLNSLLPELAMTQLRHNFTKLTIVLFAVLLLLIALSTFLAQSAAAAEAPPVEMPVSINAIMVTLVDHAAHHIWDYGTMEREIADEEWRIVEYYAIQLAAAGPAITLGGTGDMDNSWVLSPLWTEYARNMSSVAQQAIIAAQDHDKEMLRAVGNDLTDSCDGCHETFKPDLPTEGITHDPDYDLLYHVFDNWH
jgi:hypothetical protein